MQRARARGTRAEWAERVKRWQASGLSRAEFARRAGVHPGTLAWWRWKLEARGRRAKPRGPRQGVAALSWVELRSEPAVVAQAGPVERGEVELELGGVTIRLREGFDAGTLARVLEVVGARG